MSLILKGIDLPKGNTAEIIIRIQPNGEVRDSHGILLDVEAKQISTPHGRLIDETEVKKNSIYDDYDLYVSWTEIDNAPTILEAEES